MRTSRGAVIGSMKRASASSLQESTIASSSDASCVPETLFELTHAGEYTLGVVDGSRPGCIASSSWAEAASWLASEDDPAEAEEWCGGHNVTTVEGMGFEFLDSEKAELWAPAAAKGDLWLHGFFKL